jgi:redox-sensitive bicupin YhaK (pirin superfamily)
MSNLDRTPALSRCGGLADVAPRPVHEVFPGKKVALGESTEVWRLLPNLGRRLVGAWCFVDHYGPDDIATGPGMQVPPHPHIGLQTVSWLLDGEVHHRDSLGSDQHIRPGQLGLMTAGAGITHAEQSPVPHPAMLHGVQLWVALPEAARAIPPNWEYHPTLPTLSAQDVELTVFLGTLADTTAPGRTYSDLVGVSIRMGASSSDAIAVEPDFEYAALVMSGSVTIDDDDLSVGSMLYLGTGRSLLEFSSTRGAVFMLLGGTPFEEQIVMWWNFVARSSDEIAVAREAWAEGTAFGDVAGYHGYRLPAPPLPPGRLKPGGATR